jgi:large subunit ribosomal protein L10
VNRSRKLEIVERLKEVFSSSAIIIVARNQGITVSEVNSLRRNVRNAGSAFCVTKNSLAKIAMRGTEYEELEKLFVGPTSIAYSSDPIAAAKVLVEYVKTNSSLEILGGMMGNSHLDADQVKALASLPSLDELRGELIGLINAPASKVAQVLQAPASQLARVCKSYAEKE